MDKINIESKQGWKDRRVKVGTVLDRKLTSDILKVRREHDKNIREIEKKTEHSAFIVAGCILAGLVLMILCGTMAHATNINMDIISDIESGGDSLAVNGAHIGEYQLSQGVVTMFNASTGGYASYTLEDMYISAEAFHVANWYMNKKIPAYLKKYNIPDNITSRIIAWNWGIGHLRKWFRNGSQWSKLPKETRNYIKKYFMEIQK